jgi:hypothetical protein
MRNIVLVLCCLLFVQCSGTKKTPVPPTPPPVPSPQWVTQRPVNSAYYIGIGSANKQFAGNDAMQAAKRNALQDMASEIEVNISSNSLLYTLESTGSGYKEDYKQTTKINTQMLLRDYEQVDVFENDKEVFVYYRLSKNAYQENRRREIAKAADYAAGAVHAARAARQTGDYRRAGEQYLSALSRFETYLNEPVSAAFEGKEVFFDNLIAVEFKEAMAEIIIEPRPAQLTLPVGVQGDGVTLGVQVKGRDGKPVANLPILLTYKDIRTDRVKGSTDADGVFDVRIKQVKRRGIIEIAYAIDAAALAPASSEITSALASRWAGSGVAAVVRGESPRIFVRLSTRISAKEVSSQQVLSGLQEGFTANGFQPEQDVKRAHLILEISVDTREVGEYNGFFTAAMSGTLVIKKADTGQELFRKDLGDIKGVDLNYSKAGRKAYESLRSAFFTDYLPQFKKRYFGDW